MSPIKERFSVPCYSPEDTYDGGLPLFVIMLTRSFLRTVRTVLGIAILLLSVSVPAFAHPLDITSSTYTVSGDRVHVTTFFHPFEIQYLLSKTVQDGRQYDFQSYFDQSDTLFAYIAEHVRLTADGEACSFAPVSMPHKEDYEMLARGVELQYVFDCPGEIEGLTTKIALFADDFPLQTNRVSVMRPPVPGQDIVPEGKSILTSRITEYTFVPGRKTLTLDTDKDGIPDDEERIYRTNPALYDTDGDGYKDGEEVYNGWDPVNPDPSPGQGGTAGSMGHIFGTVDTAADPFATGPLQGVLQKITEFTKAPTFLGVLAVLGMIYLLGFFHALSVGHGKTLLASYLVDGNRNFVQGLLFSCVLTVTHLADVLLLGLVFAFMSHLGFIAEWMNTIQIAGVLGLIGLSIYLFVTAALRVKHRSPLEPTKTAPTIVMAFLAGLAPCTFGWSILLVLMSLGKAWLAIPVLLLFGLGIFSCLAAVAFFVSFVQQKGLGRYRGVALYAPLVSSGLLIVISLSIGYQMFSGTFIA